MDPDLCIEVPPDFDDSDEDGQVHPIARRLFTGSTNVETFDRARRWLSAHDVQVIDVSWDYLYDEPNPYALSLYFAFEHDPAEDDTDDAEPTG